LVHGLFSFAERTAKEIMVPRTRVVGVPLEATPQQVIELLAEEGHTRMPVFEGELDNIKGVLHAKDVIPLLAHPELIVLQDLLRPALFVPWTKPVGDLLREMQQKRSLIALVVDEYGGFSGIVTLEDILEEIVGEIEDEHDVALSGVRPNADGSVNVDGDVTIRDLNRGMNWDLPDEEAVTVAGLLIHEVRRIPDVGQTFTVHGHRMSVLERKGNQLTELKIWPQAER
jgi:CBS domain containing-hemolysin-like protein